MECAVIGQQEGRRELEGDIHTYIHIYVCIYICMYENGWGWLALFALCFPREFLGRLMPRECKVGGTQVEVYNADERPHSPAPYYGAGAWLPPAFLGKNVQFRSTEGAFPSAGAGLGSTPRKSCFSPSLREHRAISLSNTLGH